MTYMTVCADTKKRKLKTIGIHQRVLQSPVSTMCIQKSVNRSKTKGSRDTKVKKLVIGKETNGARECDTEGTGRCIW